VSLDPPLIQEVVDMAVERAIVTVARAPAPRLALGSKGTACADGPLQVALDASV
jgi:hypothetical protein